MSTSWTKDDIAAATNGALLGNWPDTEVCGVSIDTRSLKPGEVFVALVGPNYDAHDFVDNAIKAGAAGVVVSKSCDNEIPQVVVDDTMQALVDLGLAARARSPAKIIAVTGSVGKTSTKEMLAAVFGSFKKTHASEKSYNNHWGVPLSLANLSPDAAYGVFELGMNHSGEIDALAQQVQPDLAIITTVEPVHIENFQSVDGIVDAKAEIFSNMTAAGMAVLNLDNPHYARLEAAAKAAGVQNIYSFGEDENADAHLVDFSLRSHGSQVTAEILDEKIQFNLAVPGFHIVINALAVLLAVKILGQDLVRAAKVISDFEPLTGRGQRSETVLDKNAPPLIVIDESYNASPASMDAALKVLGMNAPQGDGRRVAILGDMLELGAEGPILHASLAAPISEAGVDLVMTCGPLSEALHQILPRDIRGVHCKDSQALAEEVTSYVRPGDVVLIKGSNGSQMSWIVRALQNITEKTQEACNAI